MTSQILHTHIVYCVHSPGCDSQLFMRPFPTESQNANGVTEPIYPLDT